MVSISLIPRKHQIGCGEKRFFVFLPAPMSRLVESCPGNGKTALFAGNAGSGPGALLRRLRRRAARKAGFAAFGGEGQRPPVYRTTP